VDDRDDRDDRESDRVELRWPGKYVDGRRAPLIDHGVELRERERLGPEPEAGPANQLIRADNLYALEALVGAAPASVDLVYIDPPFATGNRFALVRRVGDKREGDEAELRLPAFDDAWDGGLAGFLRMLDPRVRLIRELLSETGSLYVHVDPTVGHAVKLLLDEVFGPRCFQREIVWRIGWVSGFKTRARNWIRNHDLIFFYTKDPQRFTFNKLWVPHVEGYTRREGKPAKAPGVAIEDVWNANPSELELTGRASLDSIQIKSFSREKTGWATQKNESLLARIIEASSDPGDVVADLFAGSGTTAVVAARLGRRFIACDHADAAVQIARARLLDAKVGFRVLEADARERDLSVAGVEEAELRAWMLAQLGADSGVPNTGEGLLAGRRGSVGLALALPGERVDAERLARLQAHCAAVGLSAIELLGFDFAADPDASTPDVIAVEAGRGLFEPSVRATAWTAGGSAIWERPRFEFTLQEIEGGRVRVELSGMHLRRPEHLPEPIHARDWTERALGWTLADTEAPTRPVFVATREQGRGPLARVAELPRPAGGAWLFACEDLLGHRHRRTLACPS
jgi:adenine-specific DNA-methyltransferase